MKISFGPPAIPRSGALVVGVLQDRVLQPMAERVDKATGGSLKRAMSAGRFKGERGQSIVVLTPHGIGASRVVLLGLGKPDSFDALAAQNAGGKVVADLAHSGEKAVAIAIDPPKGAKIGGAALAAEIAYGARLRSYRFDKYRTKEKPDQKPSLDAVTVMCAGAAEAGRAYAPRARVADGVYFTRDLVSEPANVIYPETFAREARKLARLGVKIDVLDRRQMARLGMGALLGVAQGSAHEARLVVLRWNGAPRARDKRPIAFLGKGVTFDSGGLSIKPAGGMEDMKWDMAGAGVVVGLMMALAGRKAKVNAVGVCGLVENLPSATAQRPGDVVRTMSGQTIEVINTDAEGRLVLADAMWYCQERYNPKVLIDLATLTGAIIIALGHEQAGLFANDDELAARMIAAGLATGEPVWRMPLGEAYDRDINSDIADMKNVGSGRGAGSITAAQLLGRFIKPGVKWAHLDIAGVTWSKKDTPTVPKGGTAFGVRLLDRLVAEHYEG
ncbi:MAG: leucyl aminopeptidase [Alphaproteobacteria bacterium]|nr:leucyl aminopeptidase [Alphaproteobacteria bacterium]